MDRARSLLSSMVVALGAGCTVVAPPPPAYPAPAPVVAVPPPPAYAPPPAYSPPATVVVPPPAPAPVIVTPPRVIDANAIEVVAASYGPNCGAPRGNVTGAIAAACDGRPRCDYRVEARLLGDPAPGCSKDYVVEYRCGGRPEVRRAGVPPEAGFGGLAELRCDVAPPPVVIAPPPVLPPSASFIRVVAGSYGANCGAPRGNATPALAAACDGRPECDYRVDVRALGDPTPGCSKDYVAEYQCRAGEVRRAAAPPEAGYGSVIRLSCAAPTVIVAAPPAGRPLPIRIVAASYGHNCGAPYANATAPLARACDGRARCEYRVDYHVLGDPVPNCAKDYVADYRCGDLPTIHRAAAPPESGLGSLITLHCP